MGPDQHSPASIGNVYAQPAINPAPTAALGRHGDAAGEHFHMQRGKYNAWVYVAFAFLWEIFLLALVPGLLAVWIAAASRQDMVLFIGLGAAGLVGLGGAYFVFRDRWRCIEAFSSRYCAGIMNISLLYVPIIALVYANVRGVQKLFGR